MFAVTPVQGQFPVGTLCEVCQKPINTGVGIAGEQVCRSFECVRVMKQKQTLPPSLFASMLKIQSQIMLDQEARARAEGLRRTAIDEQVTEEDLTTLKKLQSSHNSLLPSGTRLISIGSGITKMINLAEKRKRAFRDHLNETIQVASSNAKIEDIGYNKNTVRIARNQKNLQKIPALEQVTNATCSQCKGGCCVAGGNKGFLEAPLIRRVLTEKSSLRPRDVYQIYMDHLPEKSIAGSCVFHTDKGCNLSRDLRSDVCNGYLCDSLDGYHKKAIAQNRLIPALIISRGYRQFHKYDGGACHQVVSAALLREGKSKRIDLKNI